MTAAGAPSSRPPIPAAIAGPGVVAIGRGLPPDRIDALAAALVRGGIRAFEVTLTSPDALGSIRRLAGAAGDLARAARDLAGAARHQAGAADDLGLIVGAGTVVDLEGAEAAVAAGAGFLVSPHTDVEIVRWAVDRGIPVFPGALTPTEIRAGWSAGATAIKLFPASAVGAAFVRELRGPFPAISLLPTGGLTIASIDEFIAAGAVAVGLGGGLIGDGTPDGVAARAADAVAAVAAARTRVGR